MDEIQNNNEYLLKCCFYLLTNLYNNIQIFDDNEIKVVIKVLLYNASLLYYDKMINTTNNLLIKQYFLEQFALLLIKHEEIEYLKYLLHLYYKNAIELGYTLSKKIYYLNESFRTQYNRDLIDINQRLFNILIKRYEFLHKFITDIEKAKKAVVAPAKAPVVVPAKAPVVVPVERLVEGKKQGNILSKSPLNMVERVRQKLIQQQQQEQQKQLFKSARINPNSFPGFMM
jgi:hypothetical protein